MEIVQKTHAEVPLLARATVAGKTVSKMVDEHTAALPKPPPTKISQLTGKSSQSSLNKGTSLPAVPKDENKKPSATQATPTANSSKNRRKTNGIEGNTAAASVLPQNISKSTNRELSRNVKNPVTSQTKTPNVVLGDSIIEDDVVAIEPSPVASNEEFQSKNMAALSMIRKLKQAKVNYLIAVLSKLFLTNHV